MSAPEIANLQQARDANDARRKLLHQAAALATRPPEPAPAKEIAALRAEHVRHTAELKRADATLVAQAASQAHISRQARLLWVALALAVTLGVAAGLAPGWVR